MSLLGSDLRCRRINLRCRRINLQSPASTIRTILMTTS
jgi:hypothetical protein